MHHAQLDQVYSHVVFGFYSVLSIICG